VDCGSVSTKCVLLDGRRQFYRRDLPANCRASRAAGAGVDEKVEEQYGHLLPEKTPMVACTTGSGRFLAQKILGAEYAVDEITCQAEGVKSLYTRTILFPLLRSAGRTQSLSRSKTASFLTTI
jgi:activator of 2-hydroxyglutaryl-CoA dehydratase